MSQLTTALPATKKISRTLAPLAIALGVLLTFCVYGYRFGTENHTVYLLDALRRSDPPVLQQDWFTTQTMQYHVAFTYLSEFLMKLRILQPGFLLAYLTLVILFHIAVRGIVKHLGGDDAAYLVCIALYFLSAAGTALGTYQFFQDSSLLPSNIAAVAMLMSIYLHLKGRSNWSGVCLGIAGIFHLNFAVIGIPLWLVMYATKPIRLPIAATILAIVPSLINIAAAVPMKLSHSGGLPFSEFLDLYVRLRHPHHYDPSTWPIALWFAALWPIVPGIILLRGTLRRVFIFFVMLNIVALIGAGIWYFNESLVQMSLYRFSIYSQLLGCVAAATWIATPLNRKRTATFTAIAICLSMMIVSLIRGPFFGAFHMPDDDADYVKLCQWASQNTPVDAIFLVPPDEQSMRLIGRRVIIVNYKCVPQLSSELRQWRDRLCDVLALNDLNQLPRGYLQTLPAIRLRYDQLSLQQLSAAAEKYQARYIVSSHAIAEFRPVDASGRYILYDLSR
jgi:hypothetical protein